MGSLLKDSRCQANRECDLQTRRHLRMWRSEEMFRNHRNHQMTNTQLPPGYLVSLFLWSADQPFSRSFSQSGCNRRTKQDLNSADGDELATLSLSPPGEHLICPGHTKTDHFLPVPALMNKAQTGSYKTSYHRFPQRHTITFQRHFLLVQQ